MECKHCGETFFRKNEEPPSRYCPTCVKMYKGDVDDATTKPPIPANFVKQEQMSAKSESD